jgi:hypothetical protein
MAGPLWRFNHERDVTASTSYGLQQDRPPSVSLTKTRLLLSPTDRCIRHRPVMRERVLQNRETPFLSFHGLTNAIDEVAFLPAPGFA